MKWSLHTMGAFVYSLSSVFHSTKESSAKNRGSGLRDRGPVWDFSMFQELRHRLFGPSVGHNTYKRSDPDKKDITTAANMPPQR